MQKDPASRLPKRTRRDVTRNQVIRGADLPLWHPNRQSSNAYAGSIVRGIAQPVRLACICTSSSHLTRERHRIGPGSPLLMFVSNSEFAGKPIIARWRTSARKQRLGDTCTSVHGLKSRHRAHAALRLNDHPGFATDARTFPCASFSSLIFGLGSCRDPANARILHVFNHCQLPGPGKSPICGLGSDIRERSPSVSRNSFIGTFWPALRK
jgi:hypothetical protein